MIELTFLKELMATREANQSSAIFANIGIFLKMRFSVNCTYVMDAIIYYVYEP